MQAFGHIYAKKRLQAHSCGNKMLWEHCYQKVRIDPDIFGFVRHIFKQTTSRFVFVYAVICVFLYCWLLRLGLCADVPSQAPPRRRPAAGLH